MKWKRIGGGKVYLLPVIHGLKGEEEKVRKAFEEVKPDCVAIGIPPEDIEIMENMDEKNEEEFEMSLQYQYYLFHLSKYGEISLPPLDIKVAYEMAKASGVPFKAIDIDDEEYAELLVDNVSIFSLIRHSAKIRRMGKKKFKAKSAEEFVKEWNREILSIKAFRRLEEIRDDRMVKKIIELCNRYRKVLAIIPLEKYDSISMLLERYKK